MTISPVGRLGCDQCEPAVKRLNLIDSLAIANGDTGGWGSFSI